MGWRVFLSLQRHGGLRRLEAYDVRLTDVDMERHQIRVVGRKTLRTKRNPVRFVPMNEPLERIVAEAITDLQPGEQRMKGMGCT